MIVFVKIQNKLKSIPSYTKSVYSFRTNIKAYYIFCKIFINLLTNIKNYDIIQMLSVFINKYDT